MSPCTPIGRAVRVCAFLLVTASTALAEPAAAPEAVLPDASFSILRVLGALLFVLALFLSGVWLFRRWQVSKPGTSRGPRLEIIEARSLGGRQALYVIGYERERLLISTSPAGVQLLTRLPEGDVMDPAPAATPGFAAALQQVISRREP